MQSWINSRAEALSIHSTLNVILSEARSAQSKDPCRDKSCHKSGKPSCDPRNNCHPEQSYFGVADHTLRARKDTCVLLFGVSVRCQWSDCKSRQITCPRDRPLDDGCARDDACRPEEVSVSRALAGHVAVLGTEEPASGVTVELCSPDWKKIIAATKTDDEGHFSFEKPANTRLFYLRVSAPGMDIYQLRVRIEKHAAEELKIHLSVAT
jgi:hypothetical protein